MMSKRKILYSPGYGAGWSSWANDSIAKFVLEYQPIIERLESGGKVDEPLLDQLQKDINSYIGKETHFYTGGAKDLVVATVSGRVRINEYDGYESYEEEGSYAGWM